MSSDAQSAAADSAPHLGTSVGKYRILRVLGRGGMGVVYEAEDTALKRLVAIKFLPTPSATTAGEAGSAVERFVQEARSAAKLSHPNIIAIHDIGQEAGAWYMVMERLSAQSVGALLRDRGPLPWVDATRILAECCSALQAAHAAGLIHRDIKPENILLDDSGRAKLVDFGLVKDLNSEGQHLTQSGALVGTPLYMSPEQGSGKPLDGRSDLYSLGATYFALLTGKPPFSGPTPHLLFQHYMEPLPDPRLTVPSLPEACLRILSRATQKDPDARYASAAQMQADAESALAGLPRSGAVIAADAKPPAAPSSPSALPSLPLSPSNAALSVAGAAASRIERGRPSSLRHLLLGVPVLLLGLVAVGWGLWRAGRSSLPTGPGPSPAMAGAEPIKVGVLHSLSGSLATTERPIVDATLLAIEELNQAGGLLGRRIEPVIVDGKSDSAADGAFCQGAKRLIEQEQVAVLFGTWTSAARRALKPLLEASGQLLIYPAAHEGLEDSEAILYVGATPNQQVLPAVRHFAEQRGLKRLFFVGSDGIYPRAVHTMICDEAKKLGIEVIGEHYAAIGETHFAAAIHAIERHKPEVIVNTLRGDSSAAFLRELRSGRHAPVSAPVLSFGLGEGEIQQLADFKLHGDFLGTTYLPSLDTKENRQFIFRFQARYGAHRSPDDSAEAAYVGVKLWAQAAHAAQSADPRRVRPALANQTLAGPAGPTQIDPSTHHVFKRFRLARFGPDNRLQLVSESPSLIPPMPFPGPRLRVEWEAFLREHQQRWQGSWAGPAAPAP